MIENLIDPSGSMSLNCDICGGTDTSCICPECEVCGEIGNPDCIENTHMPFQKWEKNLCQMKGFLEKDTSLRQYVNENILLYIEKQL